MKDEEPHFFKVPVFVNRPSVSAVFWPFALLFFLSGVLMNQ
ncbi:hypothetical protein I656_02174 [Geobacillus sp. WSUCF1]|nr:hypothetical protein I656_02174 [Geobacillus sp. WSUCF1]